MGVSILGLDRQEGAGADVQGQRLVADPRLGKRRHQFGREMERRRGRGDGALLPREHRLIIGAVAVVGGAAAGDIRRQRHPPGALEQQLGPAPRLRR